MADILYVDTVDMGTNGLVVRRVTGHRDMPEREWPVKEVPGSTAGAVFMSNEPVIKPRKVMVYGTVKGTTHAGMITNINALITALQSTGDIDVSFSDDLTKKLVCRCTKIDIDDFDAGFIQRACSVSIELVAANPNWVAV